MLKRVCRKFGIARCGACPPLLVWATLGLPPAQGGWAAPPPQLLFSPCVPRRWPYNRKGGGRRAGGHKAPLVQVRGLHWRGAVERGPGQACA